jgi:uncharacterized protein (DUF2252 family)
MMSATVEALATAHARLLADGRPATVRALKQAAGVSTDAAAAWLRDNEPAAALPAMPDLGNALKIIWSAAWTAAEEQSRQTTEERVSMARQGEAEALAAAAAAAQAGEQARAAGTAAEEQMRAAETRTAQLEQQLTEAKTALNLADQARRTAEIAQARAEAEADSLRKTLPELREDLRAALRRRPEPSDS